MANVDPNELAAYQAQLDALRSQSGRYAQPSIDAPLDPFAMNEAPTGQPLDSNATLNPFAMNEAPTANAQPIPQPEPEMTGDVAPQDQLAQPAPVAQNAAPLDPYADVAQPEQPTEPVQQKKPTTGEEFLGQAATRAENAGNIEIAAIKKGADAQAEQNAISAEAEDYKYKVDAYISEQEETKKKQLLTDLVTMKQAMRAEYDAEAKRPIDDKRRWNNMGTGEKLGNIVLAGLSGLLAPYNNGRNTFLEQYDKLAQQDIEEQRRAKQERLDILKQKGLDDEEYLKGRAAIDVAALEKYRAGLMTYLGELGKQAANAKTEGDRAAAIKQIADVENRMAANEANLGKTLLDAQQKHAALLAKQRKSGGGSVGANGPQLLPGDVVVDRNGRYVPAKDVNEATYVKQGFVIGGQANGFIVGDSTEKRLIQEQLDGRQRINQVAERMLNVIDMAEKEGVELVTAGDLAANPYAAELASLTKQLVVDQNVMAKLGAISEGDAVILDKIAAGDPTAIISWLGAKAGYNDIRSKVNSMTGLVNERAETLIRNNLPNNGLDANGKPISIRWTSAGKMGQDQRDREKARLEALRKKPVENYVSSALALNKSDKAQSAAYSQDKADAKESIQALYDEAARALETGKTAAEGTAKPEKYDAKDAQLAIDGLKRIGRESTDKELASFANNLSNQLGLRAAATVKKKQPSSKGKQVNDIKTGRIPSGRNF